MGRGVLIWTDLISPCAMANIWLTKRVLLCLLIVVCAGLNYGYNLTSITSFLHVIFDHWNVLYREKHEIAEAEEGLNEDLITEILSATLIAGAMVGSLAAGPVCDRFGRKRPNILLAALCSLSCALSALAQLDALQYVWLAVTRAVLGLGVGFTGAACPMFVAELAPTKLRGRLNTLFQVFITVGILLAYGVGAGVQAPLDKKEGCPVEGCYDTAWVTLAVGLIPMIPIFCSFPRMPESAYWLGRVGGGQAAPARERSSDRSSASALLEGSSSDAVEVVQLGDEEAAAEATWSEIFHDYSVCFWLGILLAIGQQITGINGVIIYAPQIFSDQGIDEGTASLIGGVGVSAWNFLTTLIGLALIDKLGRKPLLLWGFVIMAVGLALLWLADVLLAPYADPADDEGKFSFPVLIVGLVLFLLGFEIGPGPVFYVLISEIYPIEVKGRMISLVNILVWLFNLIIVLTFPSALGSIGGWIWFIFFVFSIIAIFAVQFLAIETKNVPLNEIRSFVYKPRGKKAAAGSSQHSASE
eukprot:gnl/Chilomastix_cuspidata/331.p2 GENE.gnl/Chilomastix_cuspidata/331~~gnl/Chilomastix_cuspidata/331.p2  ORF type:complete len:528 (-),score=240.68 gnl/Chilomastix_cuspidata/331:1793-3376(-)